MLIVKDKRPIALTLSLLGALAQSKATPLATKPKMGQGGRLACNMQAILFSQTTCN
jgi:hypothetical protein